MAQKNVEIVRATYEAWFRGDFEQALSAMDEGIEWEIAEDEPDARTVRGLAGVAAVLREWFDSFEGFSGTPQEFIDVADHVVVPIRFSGLPRGGNVPVTIEETHVFTVRGGAIGCVRSYRTKAQALDAVGRPERDSRG